MLAIGAGGLDVAVAMGGGAYYITMPKMVRVNLTGKLSPWVSAKDIILAVLRVMSVKGGVGKIVEYGGEGVATLTVPEKSNNHKYGCRGLVLQLLYSHLMKQQESSSRLRVVRKIIQNSKLMTMQFMMRLSKSTFQSLNRLQLVRIHLTMLSQIKELEGKKIDQVCIGSCTNSSYL